MREGASRTRPARPLLTLDKTAPLVSRFLGVAVEALEAAFRPATRDELPALVAMRRELIGAEIFWDDTAYLSWRYALGREGAGWGDCWVLVIDGVLQGMVGVERLRVSAAGEQETAWRVMDLLIRPELESKGLGPWMLLTLKARLGHMMALGSNPNSKKLVSRVFSPLADRRSHVHPLRVEGALKRRIRQPVVACVAGWAANIGLRVARTAALLVPPGGRIAVTRSDVVPDDAEALFARAVHPDRVEVQRSLAHWRWRLTSPRTRADVWVARRDGELVGLMITRQDQEGSAAGSWSVLDVVIDESCKAPVFKRLLRHTVTHAWRARAPHLLWVNYRRDLEALLPKWFLVAAQSDYKTVCFSSSNAALQAAVERNPDWSLTELHMDSE